MERMIFVNGDEGFYTSGTYTASDWGPLYMLHYHVLNYFTEDVFKSLYFNYLSLTFILIPAFTYLTLKNLGVNILCSSFVAILALFSTWNYPSETRVHIYNYILLLMAFNLRWTLKKNYNIAGVEFNSGKIAFYGLLALSIYARQDNIIITAIAISWDILHSKNKKELLLPVFCYLWIYVGLAFLFGNTYTNHRSVEIFLDHFSWNNTELFQNAVRSGIPLRPLMYHYFDRPESLMDVIKAQPEDFFNHILKNIFMSYRKLLILFSLDIDKQWIFAPFIKLFFVLSTISIFSKGLKSDNFSQLNFKEIYLLSIVFIVKCFSISILLNWYIKYFFELQIILFIWMIIIFSYLRSHWVNTLKEIKKLFKKISKLTRVASNSFSKNNLQRFFNPQIYILVIPMLFFFYNYEYQNHYEKGLYTIVETLKNEHKRQPIKNILSSSEVFLKPYVDYKIFDPYYIQEYNTAVQNDFKKFLRENEIDTVLIYEEFRKLSRDNGFETQFKDFESNYSSYGYKKIYANKYKQIIYRIKNNN